MIQFPLQKYFDDNFWISNHSYDYQFRRRYEDGFLIIECDLPGIDKEEIQIDYLPDTKIFHIFVKDKIDNDIYINKQIVDDKIEAELSLGVLKIRAPLLKSSKRIQIK